MRLLNKIALITGAGDGIGRGIAIRFACEGAKVGVLDVNEAKCHETVAMIHEQNGQAMALVVDVRDVEQVHWAADTLARKFGPINVAVNNAAVMPVGKLHETSPEDFERCIAVNLRGTFLVSREVIPMMLQQHGGSIIHMSSVTGMLGLPGIAIYSATKAALAGLTRAMSTDYARDGIRVNCVSPGTIDSPMLHNFVATQKPANQQRIRKEFDEMHPIGRVGQIDEVASVFVFLASDESSFVTGANYTVDGGLSVKGQQPQD
jgi:NAD(P)-dependent dehydrogenase (short-subunit alcohol dehydrogenase family)